MPAVFDINETTLDLAPVRSVLDHVLNEEGGFIVWFQKLLQLSMATTAAGHYADFTALAQSALHAVAATSNRETGDREWAQVAQAMGTLEPYPDVADGLTRLREAGWTTIALTNSATASVEAQLDRAGLMPLFDHVLSVDAVRTYKPARAPYVHAAEVAGVRPDQLWMVACHDWDLAGARAAGLSTAFVRRPGMTYASVYEAPEMIVNDFGELADRLIALD